MFTKLVKLLNKTVYSSDEEILEAIAEANELLREKNFTWQYVLRGDPVFGSTPDVTSYREAE